MRRAVAQDTASPAAVPGDSPLLGSKRARDRSAEARSSPSRGRSSSSAFSNFSAGSQATHIDKEIDTESDREVDLSGLETDEEDEEEVTQRYDLLC